MFKSREAHAGAAKSLKKNMKKYSSKTPPEMEDQGHENPGVEGQESKAVKKAEATVGKKKG